jgi:cytochrome c peroxidase
MLFTEAFGDPAITTERIAKALAQFVRSIVSFNA